MEEAYDGRSWRYNDECWNIRPYNSDGSYKYELWDSLASFHVNSCTFAFADGHAEKYKWKDDDTTKFFADRQGTAGDNTYIFPGNVDIEWLADHYPFMAAQ